MGILQTEGIDALLRTIAGEAAARPTVEAAAGHAASLGGRITAGLGLQALTREEDALLAAAIAARADLAAPGSGTERLVLSSTGRLRLLRGNADPGNGHVIGAVAWRGRRPSDLDARLGARAAEDSAEASLMKEWLAGLPAERVAAMIVHVRECLQHMAPVLLYTGAGTYSNLGKNANLVGKSVKADSPECVLNRLAATPVTQWAAQDASFLACLHVLITSGPPVRAEEFSGTQLRPDRLHTFLVERIGSYGAAVPDVAGRGSGEALQILGQACASGRTIAVAAGAQPYRLIEGLNLNKQERVERTPVSPAELPPGVLEELQAQLGCAAPGTWEDVAAACAEAMPSLHTAGGPGFTTRLEQVLHEITRTATEGLRSHVGMTRGPRRTADLIDMLRADNGDMLAWTTKDFFCCVTPSRSFSAMLAPHPEQLPQALRAISARMRYNGWHYLPHTVGLAGQADGRDWFFAPTMSDVTNWSDQHHTGHVAHGVRYALRVPFGIDMAGARRPGMHDFRVMRAHGQPYTREELRSSVAVGEVLRRVYQAHADRVAARTPSTVHLVGRITDFDNSWYQDRYTAPSARSTAVERTDRAQAPRPRLSQPAPYGAGTRAGHRRSAS